MEQLGGIYLSLGSNLGDRIKNISDAIAAIGESCQVLRQSDMYTSKSWGFDSSHEFINCCIEISTEKSANQLIRQLKQIENKLGRTSKKSVDYEDRLIDIDIILFRDEIILTESLIIPHPHFRKRNFVLVPLDNIASNTTDPITSLSIHQLVINSTDKSELQLLTP